MEGSGAPTPAAFRKLTYKCFARSRRPARAFSGFGACSRKSCVISATYDSLRLLRTRRIICLGLKSHDGDMNALLYIASTGCQWRFPPKEFPPSSTVQKYFYISLAGATRGRRTHLRLVRKIAPPRQRLGAHPRKRTRPALHRTHQKLDPKARKTMIRNRSL